MLARVFLGAGQLEIRNFIAIEVQLLHQPL